MWRRLLDLLLIVWVSVMLITGLPGWVPGVRPLEGVVWKRANTLGLAQCGWSLFAPNPTRSNVWLEVVLTADDGSTASWSTPNWQELSEFQSVIHIRWYKYARKLNQDSAVKLRKPLLNYVTRQIPPPEGRTWKHARLLRHVWTVPNRSRLGKTKIPLPWPPSRDRYPRTVVVAERNL